MEFLSNVGLELDDSKKRKQKKLQQRNTRRKREKGIYSFLTDGKHEVWMADPMKDLPVYSRVSKYGNIYRNLRNKELDPLNKKKFFVQVLKDMDQYCGSINEGYLEKLYYDDEKIFVYITKKFDDRNVVVALMVFNVGFFYQDMDSKPKSILKLELVCSKDTTLPKQGYGSYLMKLLEDIAEAMNIDTIHIPEAVGDENKKFYQSKGYQAVSSFRYGFKKDADEADDDDEAKNSQDNIYFMQKELQSTPLGSLTSSHASPSTTSVVSKSKSKKKSLISSLRRFRLNRNRNKSKRTPK